MDSSLEETTSDSKKENFTRLELFNLFKDDLNINADSSYRIIEKAVKKSGTPFELPDSGKGLLRKTLFELRKRWQQASRIKSHFLSRNEKWLSTTVSFAATADCVAMAPQKDISPAVGRPSCSFNNSSERSKRRKTEEIRAKTTSEELTYAAQMSLRASGQVDAANILKDISTGSPSKPSKYRSALKQVRENPYTPDESLSLIIEGKMSKNQYNLIRYGSLQKNSVLYPAYKYVLESKKKCYPNESSVTVTENRAFVNLQALLDHTTQRILELQVPVIESLKSEKVQFNLVCKWGCDGTSGQSNYKQKFSDSEASDDSIFFVSLVPLQLTSDNEKESSKLIIWKNPRPASPRYCRPIDIEFLKETAETTLLKVNNVKEQQRNLKSFKCVKNGIEIEVNYDLFFTMVDGKVCNSMSGTSSAMRCYLCHATSKDFNDLENILRKPIIEEHLQFGISSLHAWIRIFECCLHLSYKLDIKKWQNRGADKVVVENKKKYIQQCFREELGLIVDKPKPGFGSTNDGNTARRFFEHSTTSAKITGLDESLIEDFHVILQVLSCGFDIDLNKFESFCLEAARKYVKLYPWYPMPTTLHKILIHGPRIIEQSLLPIGQMSEEAQEACNKSIKNFRENFSRKCSREKNIEDIFNRLLVASDPIITSLRKLPKKKLKLFSPRVLNLLVSSENNTLDSNGENEGESDHYTSDDQNDDDNDD